MQEVAACCVCVQAAMCTNACVFVCASYVCVQAACAQMPVYVSGLVKSACLKLPPTPAECCSGQFSVVCACGNKATHHVEIKQRIMCVRAEIKQRIM